MEASTAFLLGMVVGFAPTFFYLAREMWIATDPTESET